MHVQVTPETAEWAIPGLLRLDYCSPADGLKDWALLAEPAAGGNDWVVMIHGHGSAGHQLFVRPDLRDSWLPLYRREGVGLLTVNLRGNAWMSPAAAEDLTALLGWLEERHPGGRRILASGSMGGTSNLIYAALHPGRVAGVIALCPATDLTDYVHWCRGQSHPVLREIEAAIQAAYGGRPEEQPAVYRRHSAVEQARVLTMPTVVVHAEGDAIIPAEQSRRLAAALPADAPFRYREIPGGHHDTPLTELGWAWATLQTLRCEIGAARVDRAGS
jgi:pimeloyl-ACP methyl ester carboxylesterase